ncbi:MULTISPECIES: transporter substrate-binding domain-containing protein [unclassified Pseudodesulfovibrio]|uniref:transporter substrate-binding domain-containing protein n=1 Tax=unclassified Pseudodesulfovibrio TaxID=2661612 RepID=UPI000FEBE218|nr:MULTISPECIES: transporter substrate-binding domain-containing protein [unclassified Pseudodesulfovibrio]MCJ2164955.1 transporter substrate-binding domain-containing protein [Pseudodesulfovibrio sp. S3-i]RWU03601.1 hypothetical protein DWB63_11005 [Pseudodesulfovibrio sp. S3]
MRSKISGVGGVCLLIVFLLASVVYAEEETFICGVAQGYPPYQFVGADGTSTGLDVEVIRLVFEKMGRDLTVRQDNWDDIVAGLRLGKLDCIAGMEINERRNKFFDFTSPYYSRKGMIFVLADSFVHSFSELQWQVVTGDRDSYVEEFFREKGVHRHIRLYQTKSKEQSMEMLKQGKAVAAIAPKAVGVFLACKYDVDVRMIDVGDPGVPVGIAVAKGNRTLLMQMEAALNALVDEGALQEVLKRWQTP